MNSKINNNRCHNKRSLSAASRTSRFDRALNSLSMDDILERENMLLALKKVKSNKGSPGQDKMTVEELPKFLKKEWLGIKEALKNNTYKPQAVKVVFIPKPKGGKHEPELSK